MVTVFWTAQAEEDLKDIFLHIAKGSKKYAHIQVQKIKQATHILVNNPKAGKALLEYNSPTIREISEGNYHIIYTSVNQNRVDILLVHHGARSLENRVTE